MQKYSILGVQVNNLTRKEVEKKFSTWLTENNASFHQIGTTNPEFIMEAQKNERFKNILNSAALSLADGFGILCAILFLYGKKIERMTGVQTTLTLAELAEKYQKKVYLLGALPGVAEKCAQELKKRFPKLNIVGAEEGIPQKIHYSSGRAETSAFSGRFTIHELNNQLCQRITDSQADILLVAFGAPKQDIWISDNKQFLPTVRIAIGVGGTFDYLSGFVPYSPTFFRILGLEWLFRLFIEPKRINRIITAIIRFPLTIFWYKIINLKS